MWVLLALLLGWPCTLLKQTAVSAALEGGGEVSIQRDGGFVRVTVRGPRAGLASLCVGDDARVRILHASAAAAEAVYEQNADRWTLKSGFEWKLRASPRTGPSEADVRQFLEQTGWVANTSIAGHAERAFRIRVDDRIRFIGVTFLATGEPLALSHWPASMADDCRAIKIVQGYLPETASFRPATWHPLASSSLLKAAAPQPADQDAAVAAWRTKHEEDYRRNFATIAGLHDLKDGPNTAGSAANNDVVLPPSTPATIGRFVRSGGTVRFEPNGARKVLLRGQPVTAPIELRDDSSREVDELVIGDVRIVIHRSGENRTVRVRDPNGPQAKNFAGFAWFPIDPAWRVTGRFVRDATPRRLKVLNTYGDADDYLSEGVVEFTLSGQTMRLRPFTTRPGRLYFVFRDASSGQETYETARFLYADLKDDGSAVLDFNMAYNPPCAFNPYTTCPVPLKENRLPVKILAGEKAYAGKLKE